jgi:hypothetical protein
MYGTSIKHAHTLQIKLFCLKDSMSYVCTSIVYSTWPDKAERVPTVFPQNKEFHDRKVQTAKCYLKIE